MQACYGHPEAAACQAPGRHQGGRKGPIAQLVRVIAQAIAASTARWSVTRLLPKVFPFLARVLRERK